MNLRSFIESRVEKHPAKPFLYFQKEVLSYESFDRKVNQAANGFMELGVKKGDRVVLLLSNRPEFLYAWFGLAKIGAVMVPLNTGFKEKEAGYVVSHSEAVGLIFERESLPVAQAVQKESATLKWVGCVDPLTEGGIFPRAALLPTSGN